MPSLLRHGSSSRSTSRVSALSAGAQRAGHRQTRACEYEAANERREAGARTHALVDRREDPALGEAHVVDVHHLPTDEPEIDHSEPDASEDLEDTNIAIFMIEFKHISF